MDLGVICMEKPRPENLTERLISEVKSRPMLWDKYNDLHNNHKAMDREWDNIARNMKRQKEFLRTKWKNLRDQFQRELKRILITQKEAQKPYTEVYTGKWIYFQELLFLKSSLTQRRNHASQFEEVEVSDDEIKEELITIEEHREDSTDPFILSYENDHVLNDTLQREQNELQESPINKVLQFQINTENEKETTNANGSDSEKNNVIGQKRKASDLSQAFKEDGEGRIKCRKMSLAEDTNEIDDDLCFVKSLVPFLRKLCPVRKLIVRNEIQNILLKENLCDKCNGSRLCRNAS